MFDGQVVTYHYQVLRASDVAGFGRTLPYKVYSICRPGCFDGLRRLTSVQAGHIHPFMYPSEIFSLIREMYCFV
jgi:hypothetical protein